MEKYYLILLQLLEEHLMEHSAQMMTHTMCYITLPLRAPYHPHFPSTALPPATALDSWMWIPLGWVARECVCVCVWGVLYSPEVFLTWLFSTSNEPIHCERELKPPKFALFLPGLWSSALAIRLLARPTAFMTQMLQQLEGPNICWAFLLRPRCPQLQCAAGSD